MMLKKSGHQPEGKETGSPKNVKYNKEDCHENNLITLCRSCNVKVNFNRKKWGKLLKKKIPEGFLLTH